MYGRIPLFLVTFKPAVPTHRILSRLRMRHFFQQIITGSAGDPTRAAMLARLAVRHGLAPSETLYVGDRASDIEAARAVGMISMLVGGLREISCLPCDRVGCADGVNDLGLKSGVSAVEVL